MNIQLPTSEHYSHRYESKQRLASYWHQIDECIAIGGKRVLVVGKGTGTVPFMLERRGFEVLTLDLQPELKPSLIGDVRSMPLADGSVDVVICSQVLEHMPYEFFEPSLRELGRVARNGVVLSLPDNGRYLKIDITGFRIVRSLFVDVPRLRLMPKEFDGEHYWEVNSRGYRLGRIDRSIRNAGLRIEKSFRVFELPWHRFWRLRPSRVASAGE